MWSPGVPRIPSLEAPGDVSGEGLRLLEWSKERCGDPEMVRMEAKWGEGLETNFFSFWIFLQSKGPKEDTTGTKE